MLAPNSRWNGKSGPPFHNVNGAPAIGREGTAWKDGRPWRQSLHFRLLGHLHGVVHFDPQIPNRALQFGVTQQKLDSPEVGEQKVLRLQLRVINPPQAARSVPGR